MRNLIKTNHLQITENAPTLQSLGQKIILQQLSDIQRPKYPDKDVIGDKDPSVAADTQTKS